MIRDWDANYEPRLGMGSRVKQLGSKDSNILFDTSKSLEENKQKKVQKDMEDFDKLLSSDDNNTFQ